MICKRSYISPHATVGEVLCSSPRLDFNSWVPCRIPCHRRSLFTRLHAIIPESLVLVSDSCDQIIWLGLVVVISLLLLFWVLYVAVLPVSLGLILYGRRA